MAKKAYRVRNWNKYNEALVNRGSITFWFDEEAIKNWHKIEQQNKRGRPKKYSDLAITCGLTLKAIFKLPFRAVEGFITSLVKVLKLEIETPDYTLLCKRQKNLNISLQTRQLNPGEKLVILVDTSGLKVFGEGEWKVRQHGYVKHRLWRKLHLAINEKHQIESFELTELGIQDCEGFDSLIKNIDKEIDSAIGDGAYDRFRCYELAQKNNFKMIAPPQKNAATSYETRKKKKRVSQEALAKRDEAVMEVRKLGAKAWKEKIGYHRRSLAETAMFRIKTMIGNRLSTRLIANQRTETAIWCSALNKMTTLGMPNSVAI